jgi:hypothetical protein
MNSDEELKREKRGQIISSKTPYQGCLNADRVETDLRSLVRSEDCKEIHNKLEKICRITKLRISLFIGGKWKLCSSGMRAVG